MTKETGGPAFPKAALDPWGNTTEIHKGMTLRDYFAAEAMQGLIWGYTEGIEKHYQSLANTSYAVADAMIKARNT